MISAISVRLWIFYGYLRRCPENKNRLLFILMGFEPGTSPGS